jgi:TPR repeat protein
MANQKSVSETRATGSVASNTATSGGVAAEGPEGPIVGTWSNAAPWNDPSVTSRRLSIMAGVGLGFLAIFAVVGVLARNTATCDGGAECTQLGERYTAGSDGVTKDEALGARLFQRACDLGDASGCNKLGLAFESGDGVPQDYERAMDLFGRACSGGFAEGCNNQGALYEHGLGVPENLGDAQRLYSQACRHGSGLGCSNLGVLYAQGRGVPMNREQAAQLFREACSLGSSVGCNNVVDSNPVPVETIEQTP